MNAKYTMQSGKCRPQKVKCKAEGVVVCLLVIVFLVPFTLLSCSNRKEQVFRRSAILMDTLVTISVVAGSGEKAEAAMDSAFAEIGKLDRMLNFFSETSELSWINKNAGVSGVRVSSETMEVIEKALQVSEISDGAFDITIGPEISLWDFRAKKKPDDTLIKERLRLVNPHLVIIDKDKSSVFLREKGMLLDLGAIAKGYAADKAVEELKRRGIKSGLVALAGDIKGFGRKPDGTGWRIGIRNPRAGGKDDEIMATIELRDMAISTSGDYERYFLMDGKRYHHLLDPKTGYPAGGCRSVTVIAKEGLYTDAFSTAAFVLGPDKGMEVLGRMGFEGVVVDREGTIRTTSGLRDKIEFTRNH